MVVLAGRAGTFNAASAFFWSPLAAVQRTSTHKARGRLRLGAGVGTGQFLEASLGGGHPITTRTEVRMLEGKFQKRNESGVSSLVLARTQ